MKKLLSLLLVAGMVFSLIACASGQGSQNPALESTTQSPDLDQTSSQTVTENSEAARYGGTATITMNLYPGDTYDPMHTSGWKSYVWSMNVYENIISRDTDGNFCPGVCDFELSEDQLTLKLWVRDGVTFHNGDPVDIEDVKASLDRACSKVSRIKKHVAPYIQSCEIDGDVMTLQFSAYDPTTLYYFSSDQTWNVVLPKEICEKYGDEPIINQEDAIGTGPYYVTTDSEPGVKMVLKRYEDYVPVAEGHTGMAAPKKAYLDSIVVLGYDDVSVSMMALLNGDLNCTYYDSNYAEMLSATDNLTYFPDKDTNICYLAFNCINPSRPSYDPNIRKAVAAALDYAELMEYYYPLGYNSTSSPTVGNYYAEAYASADYHGNANLELAKQYLDAAGYNGEDLVYLVDPEFTDIAPIIKAQLNAAGINVKLEYMDNTSLDEYILNHDNPYDFTYVKSKVCEYVPTILAENFMVAHWDNQEKADLLAQLNTYPVGSEESIAVWKQLDKMLAEYCPSISLGNGGLQMVFTNMEWNCEGSWRYWWNAYYLPEN